MGLPPTGKLDRLARAEARKTKALRSMRAEGIDDGARGSCQHPKPVKYLGPDRALRTQYVACGRCMPCMFRRENEVLGKALCEAETSDHVWFMTLTYAGDFPPWAYGRRRHKRDGRDTANRQSFLCLKDVQRFLNRLRAKGAREGFTFRYILAGEYGGKTGRAHWHLVIFFEGNAPKLRFQRGLFDRSPVDRMARPFRRGRDATKRRRTKPGFGFEHVYIPQWPWGFVQIETEGVNQAALRYAVKYVAKGKLFAWYDAPHLTSRDDPGVDLALDQHFRLKRDESGLPLLPHFSASTRPALGARYIRRRGFELAQSGAPVLQNMLMLAPNSIYTARGTREALAPLAFHLGGAARREYLAGWCSGKGVSPLDIAEHRQVPEGTRRSAEKLHYWQEERAARALPLADRAELQRSRLVSPFVNNRAVQRPVVYRGDLLDEVRRRAEGRDGLTQFLVDPRLPVDLDEFRRFDPARGEFLDSS